MSVRSLLNLLTVEEKIFAPEHLTVPIRPPHHLLQFAVEEKVIAPEHLTTAHSSEVG